MAAPLAPLALPGALTIAQIKPAGLRHDARLQDVLHKFCVASEGPASISDWLQTLSTRPARRHCARGVSLLSKNCLLSGHPRQAHTSHSLICTR